MSKKVHTISHQDANEFNKHFIDFLVKHPDADYHFYASAFCVQSERNLTEEEKALQAVSMGLPEGSDIVLPDRKIDAQAMQIYNVTFVYEEDAPES